MPKVNSYAPAWLCRPSPGASIFTSSSVKSPAQTQNGTKSSIPTAATRTIAKRGNEVFAVVDNEIRWSDLARVKDQWQQQARQKKTTGAAKDQANGTEPPPYRVRAWVSPKCALFKIFSMEANLIPGSSSAFVRPHQADSTLPEWRIPRYHY